MKGLLASRLGAGCRADTVAGRITDQNNLGCLVIFVNSGLAISFVPQDDFLPDVNTAFVSSDGSIYSYGYVTGKDSGAVRPALWVSLGYNRKRGCLKIQLRKKDKITAAVP